MTGRIIGNLLDVKCINLDCVTEKLKIRPQFQRGSKGRYFDELKTASSYLSIILGSSTLEILRIQDQQQNIHRIFKGDQWKEIGVIFHSDIGTPIDPLNLTRDFKKALREAGLPEIRFHDLRHSAATLMLKQGVHPKIVQQRLGHTDISITLDIYSHAIPEMQTDVSQKMDEILSPVAVKFLLH